MAAQTGYQFVGLRVWPNAPGAPQQHLIGEPAALRETLAADPDISQEWNGIDMPADVWCPDESADITLTEFKHTYGARDRVLSLLLLESAAPRPWDRSWQDEAVSDSFDQFGTRGDASH